MEDENEEELNSRLLDGFRQIGAAIRRSFGRQEDVQGGAFTQQRALAVLAMQDGMSQSQLGYILGIRPQSVGELIGRLERNGLLQRQDDDNDRRMVRLTLTEQGRQQAAKHNGLPDGLFDMLDGQEKKTLAELLSKIIANTPEQLRRPSWDGPDRPHGPEPMPFPPRGPFDHDRPHGPGWYRDGGFEYRHPDCRRRRGEPDPYPTEPLDGPDDGDGHHDI